MIYHNIAIAGSQLHQVLQQERRVGLWCPVLGGLHLWGHALWPGQEPGGGGESPARADPGSAQQLSQQGLRGDEALLGHGTRGQTKLQDHQGEVGCHQPRLKHGLAHIVESETILYF